MIKVFYNQIDQLFFLKHYQKLKYNLYHKIWQAYAALLPVKTVGVMGDIRTYEHICLLRAITSEDGMTADFFHFKKKRNIIRRGFFFLSHLPVSVIWLSGSLYLQ